MSNKIIDGFLAERDKTGKFTKPPKEVVSILRKEFTHTFPDMDCFDWPVARLIWHYRNQKPIPQCQECKKRTVSWNPTTKEYRPFCSPQCSNRNKDKKQKVEDSQQQNGGHPSIRVESVSKRKATNKRRYGVENALSCPKIREKAKNTLIKKYGVDCYAKTEAAKARAKRFYTDNPSHFQNMAQKRTETLRNSNQYSDNYRSTILKRLGFENKQKFEKYLINENHVKKRTASEIAQDLNIGVSSVCKWFERFNISLKYYYTSMSELAIGEFLESNNVSIIKNDRTIIEGPELDIVIPCKKVAIEYCGLYWHSEDFKDKNYHFNKWKMCVDRGVQLLTIFEDEWIQNAALIKRMLLHKLNLTTENIYARKCNVKEIDVSDAKSFLKQNHIQGYASGSTYIALEFEGTFCAVMVFKRSGGGMLLNRYATSKPVVGGFSKLLTYYEKNYKPKWIDSFSDHRWATGAVYEKCDFKEIKKVPPDYYFVKGENRIHKFNMRHITSEKLDRNKYSINAGARKLGYKKLYDCGKTKYRKIISSTQ